MPWRTTKPVEEIPDAAPGVVSAAAVKRLRRLLRLRRELRQELNAAGLRAMDRAIGWAVIDCLDGGAHEEAGALIASYTR